MTPWIATPAQYHADPAVSRSMFLDFLPEEQGGSPGGGPELYFGRHVARIFQRKKIARDCDDIGHAFEEMLELGGPSRVRLIDRRFKRRAGNDWKQYERENKGYVLLFPEQYQAVSLMVASCMGNETARQILDARDGQVQVPLRWTDPECGLDRKALLDFVRRQKLIADLKTAASLTERSIERSVKRFGYAVQQDWYQEGASQCWDEELPFVFVFVMKTEPFKCRTVQLDAEYVQSVGQRVRDGLKRLADCYRTCNWASPPEETLVIRN